MNDSKLLGNIRPRLLPMFPLSIMLGGLELQCLKTCAALQEIGVAAKLLDFYNADDEFNILHLFASTPNYYDICYYAKQPIVISSVSGSRYPSRLRAITAKSISYLTQSVGGLQTNYDRLRKVYKSASAVICLNELEAKFLNITYGVPQNRIKIIPNGVEERYFNASGDLFIQKYGVRDFVLFTGNINKRKNPLLLAKVLQYLGLPGVFIGSSFPKEQEYAEAFATVLGNSPKLLWIRGLEHDDPLLASAYAAAQVFCLPSYSETQSISALEAMSTGTPVILGDITYAYQSPFERTLKCNPSDEAALSKCLKLAMNDPKLYSIKLSTKYTWQNIALQVTDVYKEVLTQNY